MTVIERWECPEHGNLFAPVMTADETPRCGRRACGKEIVKVKFVPESQLRGAVGLLDALDRYVGHVNCGVVRGAPECNCGFDELYTRVRAAVRGQ